MSKFDRFVPFIDIAKAAASRPGWWQDLLALWQSSGTPSGEDGLRLAIRNGYLNFYRMGQSVARVQAVNGRLSATIHAKYVHGEKADNRYVRLEDCGSIDGKPYGGIETLRAWVREAEKYAGKEKKAIDAIIAREAGVIDLEMGLPAEGQRKHAARIDVVTIDTAGELFFWEVKTYDDPRIRSSKPLDPEDGVFRQLKEYGQFLDGNRELVAAAYGRAARALDALWQMRPPAPAFPDVLRLAAARDGMLKVDAEPRLAVVVPDLLAPRSDKAWDEHLYKLQEALGPRLLVLKGGNGALLKSPA